MEPPKDQLSNKVDRLKLITGHNSSAVVISGSLVKGPHFSFKGLMRKQNEKEIKGIQTLFCNQIKVTILIRGLVYPEKDRQVFSRVVAINIYFAVFGSFSATN